MSTSNQQRKIHKNINNSEYESLMNEGKAIQEVANKEHRKKKRSEMRREEHSRTASTTN